METEIEKILKDTVFNSPNCKIKVEYNILKDQWEAYVVISAKAVQPETACEIAHRLSVVINDANASAMASIKSRFEEMEKYCISRDEEIRDLKNENINLNISIGNASCRADFYQQIFEDFKKNHPPSVIIPGHINDRPERNEIMEAFTAVVFLIVVVVVALAVLAATGVI